MPRIERLNPAQHDRAAFDCGTISLNTFLRQYARQFQERNLGITWVAVGNDDPGKILGYYTMSAGALAPDVLPNERIGLPQVSIILLGRIAVDRNAQGRGLGRLLLLHALHHALYFSSSIGTYAVVVDALDEKAVGFYEQYGFHPLPDHPFRLYLSMHEIARLPLQQMLPG